MRFTDEAQRQFDQWLNDLESLVLLDDTYVHGCSHEMGEKFRVLMTQQINDPSLRLIQSFIDQVGTTILGSVNENKVQHVISAIVDHLTGLGKSFTEPSLDDFIDITRVYYQQPSQVDVHKQRNLCVAVSIYATNLNDNQSKMNMFAEVGAFLIKSLLESDSRTCQLFAILSLENLSTERSILEILRNNTRVRHNLNQLLKYQCADIDAKLYSDEFDSLMYQVSFCACLFLEQLLHESKTIDPFKVKVLKRFSNNQSVRSDFGWNTVRLQTMITHGCYFYEVLLCTDGQMVIGWCTINSADCYHEMYIIGYDGYHRCIVRDKDKFPITESHPTVRRWQSGDVIGCLIDLATKKFIFYHNGTPIEFDDSRGHTNTNQTNQSVNFVNLISQSDQPMMEVDDPQPYFGAASLSNYQQCYYNHGEVPFKYPPPEGVLYSDLRLNKTVYVPTMCSVQ